MLLRLRLEFTSVAPPSRRLSWGLLAPDSEGEKPSGQPAGPALSEVEGMPALLSCSMTIAEILHNFGNGVFLKEADSGDACGSGFEAGARIGKGDSAES